VAGGTHAGLLVIKSESTSSTCVHGKLYLAVK